jgi:ribosomal protein S18 acetylase RimI-like enzyme
VLTHRIATTGDAVALARMNHQLIRDEGHRNPMTVSELEHRMKRWLEGGYTAVLFEQAGEVVSYALFRSEEDAIYLRQFFVKRERRRRGIGRQAVRILLDDILAPARRITLEVLVGNSGARAFWNAAGFLDYAVTMEFLRASPPPELIDP